MLILCEKPSVARDFAAALGAAGKKGYYQSGGITITYCVGHLFEPLPPEGYDPKYQKWDLADLPILPEIFRYRVNASAAGQAGTVLGLLKDHAGDEVLIATDAGREGELIARTALMQAGISNIGKFKRFWVSEALTHEVIASGIAAAKPLSDYNSISAQGFARQKADWLVGMNLSRLMSIGSPPPPFSVGRVQTAVLSCVAARNGEVKNFVPEPYKQLEAKVLSGNAVAIIALLENPKTGKPAFFKGDEAYLLAAAEQCKGKPIGSVDVEKKGKREKPEKLLNITGLQKAAFKRFGYKPEETLALAQGLYETHKCLSYPRTPSRVMGDNNAELFREKFELLKSGYPLSPYCDPSLIAPENKHIFNSAQLEDHHALIPLAALPEAAGEKERNVYAAVLESFFKVCMPDFVYNEKSLRFHAASFVFTSRIREVVKLGWKETFQQEEDGGDQEVAAFDEQNCSITALALLDKKTGPKKEFAIDTLLAFMEHPMGEGGAKLAGLGTPATRAEIIKTLFTREYLVEDKKKLYATDRGRFLLEQLSRDEHLKKMADVANTTEWEGRLAADPAAFEKEIAVYVSLCVKGGAGREAFQREPVGACPLCRKPVFETKTGYGCSGYKGEPKCSFAIWKTVAGAAVSPQDAALLLIGQKTKIKKCKNKEGKPFEASFRLEGGKVVFEFKK
jgi:DNA topoisomerase-3